MTALNSLNGCAIKDGSVIYSEQLAPNLYFTIILRYEPFYDGRNSANHQNSSFLQCEAIISNGVKHTYSNGIIGIEEAVEIQCTVNKGEWPELLPDLKTKDGFRVWQKDYHYHEVPSDLYKRKVIWLVEVPKLSLLKYCAE